MELIVLGSSASAPASPAAGAGYLVRQGDTQILLDCGSGVLGRLRQITTVDRLSAIFISHIHPDHYLDLIPMRYGLRYDVTVTARPLVLVPPGGTGFLERLGAALRNAQQFFNTSFTIVEIGSTTIVPVGDFALSFQRTTHDEPTWACAVQGTHRVVYTADTQAAPELERFAAGADLLLCEATYPASIGDLPTANHLTSLQAGQLANAAAARRLLLTHFWPGLDRSLYAMEAASAYGGPVLLAEPGLRVALATDDPETGPPAPVPRRHDGRGNAHA